MAAAAAPSVALSEEVKSLLDKYPSLSLNDRGKIHCELTGHDMPARADSIKQHVGGSAFLKASKWYSADYSKYQPWIVQSTKSSKRLFCTLTKTEINKIPEEVEAHVSTPRWRRLQQEAQAKAERKARRERGEEVEPSEDEADEDAAMLDDDGEEEAGASARGSSKGGKGAGSGSSIPHGLDDDFYEGLSEVSDEEGADGHMGGGDDDDDDDEGDEDEQAGSSAGASGKLSGHKRGRVSGGSKGGAHSASGGSKGGSAAKKAKVAHGGAGAGSRGQR